MTPKLDLVRVTTQARAMNMSTKRLLKKLRMLEKARGRTIVYGGKQGKAYEMDRTALAFLQEEFAVQDRLENLESRIKRLESVIYPE